jgi:3-oxoadipate enol-lactonase
MRDPLLLIAGLGQGSWVWRDVAAVLERDRRVLTLESRGTGALHAVEARTTVAEMAADARRLLRDQGIDRAHVAGLSMGGYVALTLALTERDSVRSLVLAGTGGGGPGRVPRPAHVARAFHEAMGAPYEEFTRRTMPYTFAPGWAEANADAFERIVAARLERPTSYETILAHADACYRFYREGCDVESIALPSLVIHGDGDLIVPVENGRMLARRLPNAQYVELEGRGHNLPLEDPPTFVQLVREFLEDVES